MANTLIAIFLTVGALGYAWLVSGPAKRRLKPEVTRFQATWSANRASAIVQAWAAANVIPSARRSLLLELPLIALYVPALVAWMRFGARTWSSGSFGNEALDAYLNSGFLFEVGALVGLVAGLADGLQHLLRLRMLAGRITGPSVIAAAAAAAAKWTALAYATSLAALGIFYAIAFHELP